MFLIAMPVLGDWVLNTLSTSYEVSFSNISYARENYDYSILPRDAFLQLVDIVNEFTYRTIPPTNSPEPWSWDDSATLNWTGFSPVNTTTDVSYTVPSFTKPANTTAESWAYTNRTENIRLYYREDSYDVKWIVRNHNSDSGSSHRILIRYNPKGS